MTAGRVWVASAAMLTVLTLTLLWVVVGRDGLAGCATPPALTGQNPLEGLDEDVLLQGAFVPPEPDLSAALDGFAGESGRQPALATYFTNWAAGFPTEVVADLAERPAVPLIAWEPWRAPDSAVDPSLTLASIAAGQHDEYLTNWAAAARASCAPILLRFGPEMNGPWVPWSEEANGNQPGDFVRAWRHVHGVFQTAGASNVMWVWSPNVEAVGVASIEDLYPGDPYVDWVGLSGFNWGRTNPWNSWMSFDEIYGDTLSAVSEITDRPVLLVEIASAEEGGDKAAWIADLFRELGAGGSIRGLAWFNEDKEADWRIESSEPSREAYRVGISDDRYVSGDDLWEVWSGAE